MTRPLCIYHANCADGFASAWAVHRRFGTEVDFYSANYGSEPPDVSGRDVLIVDFSYPLPVLQAMAESARSVLVLDHHEGAKDALSEIPSCNTGWDDWLRYGAYVDIARIVVSDEGRRKIEELLDDDAKHKSGRLAAVFDMNRSGAGITWDFLYPDQPRPRLVYLVEDRDLWRFHYDPDTRRFHAAAASYGYDLKNLELWDEVNHNAEHARLGAKSSWQECSVNWDAFLAEGAAILRAQDQLIDGIIKSSRRTMKIAGHVVPVACCPGALASEVGNRLCQSIEGKVEWEANTLDADPQINTPIFSATYYDSKDKRHFSLRAPEGGANVNAIAKQFGGGGHVRASGFSRPLGWEGDTE